MGLKRCCVDVTDGYRFCISCKVKQENYDDIRIMQSRFLT